MTEATFDTLNDPKLTSLIQQGAVGVLPTDTVYGLVCVATNKTAVEKLYKLKQREHKPGTLIAAKTSQLVQLGIKARYLKAVEAFWPGSISVVLPSSNPDLKYLQQNLPTIAVRISASKTLNMLINKVGPVLTTSANLPGEPPASTIKQAQKYFANDVDFYVDGGDLSNRQPSTIIRIVDDAIEVLREGAVKINESGEIEK